MTDYATLAGGCFWCTEAVYTMLEGVESVESGYIGGTRPNPSYEDICTGTTGHAEAIRIGFDPARISYGDLLDIFFATHDPTTLNRQGNDIGTQYRSAIFPHDSAQEADARAAIARAGASHASPVVTAIEPMAPWYPAEDYHQRYWERVGERNPYCVATIPPKLAKLRKGFASQLRTGAD